MRQDRRSFVERLDFRTSPGSSPAPMRKVALPHSAATPGRRSWSPTSRSTASTTGEMTVESLHPGVTREQRARVHGAGSLSGPTDLGVTDPPWRIGAAPHPRGARSRRRLHRLIDDREHPTFIRNALEPMRTAVDELQPDARRQLAGRARREDLSCLGQRQDARRLVNGQAAEVPGNELDLPGMDRRAGLEPQLADRVPDVDRARIALAAPSKVARKPSPVVAISWPRCASSTSRTRSLCRSSSLSHAASPRRAARSVELAMSVNSIVVRTRSPDGRLAEPTPAAPDDRDRRLVSDDPDVVAGRDVEHVAGDDLELGAIVHHHMRSARDADSDMMELAALGSGDGLDVLRPMMARLLDEAPDDQVAEANCRAPSRAGRPALRRVGRGSSCSACSYRDEAFIAPSSYEIAQTRLRVSPREAGRPRSRAGGSGRSR